MKIEQWPIDKPIPFHNNARIHNDKSIQAIGASIEHFDWLAPIVVDKEGVIIAGHGRLQAAKERGYSQVPVLVADWLSENEVAAAREADNMTQDLSFFDWDKLNINLGEIDWLDIDMSEFGFDEINNSDNEVLKQEPNKLTDTFIVPPMTVLDGRQGYWLDRKRFWKDQIGDNAEARDHASVYQGNKIMREKYGMMFNENGVSILDPVLAEISCRWFLPELGLCIDPFAGDTVFGFVATSLGNQFIGIELRKEQAEYNQKRINEYKLNGTYVCDDGRNILKHVKRQSADLLFSCPPYFDLEKYSSMDNDASNQKTYEDFYKILDTAFADSIKTLKENRFAVIVVGNVRNKKNQFYYPFIEDIINTFEDNGMGLYNHAILLTPLGSGAVKAARFMRNRKLVNCHQDVLIFYKGDTSKIKNIYPELEVIYESEDEQL